jgi:hypothetical protein
LRRRSSGLVGGLPNRFGGIAAVSQASTEELPAISPALN